MSFVRGLDASVALPNVARKSPASHFLRLSCCPKQPEQYARVRRFTGWYEAVCACACAGKVTHVVLLEPHVCVGHEGGAVRSH
mgnify:CR=1 FL=1